MENNITNGFIMNPDKVVRDLLFPLLGCAKTDEEIAIESLKEQLRIEIPERIGAPMNVNKIRQIREAINKINDVHS